MEAEYKKGKYGNIFKTEENKLYLFRANEILVMQGWPSIRAWRKSNTIPSWRGSRPIITIPKYCLTSEIYAISKSLDRIQTLKLLFDGLCPEEIELRNKLAKLQWFNLIPLEIRSIVGNYKSRHWSILSLLARCGTLALNLAHSNPAQFFMLANSWEFKASSKKNHFRFVRTVLNKKQRSQLKYLGFPGTNQMRNILLKMPHQSISIENLLLLKAIVTSSNGKENMDILSELPRVNKGVIQILANPFARSLATKELLYQISKDYREDSEAKAEFTISNARELYTYASELNCAPKVICNLRSALNFRRLIDKKIQLYFCKNKIEFPKQPFKGTKSIIPINNSIQLAKQAKYRNNCLMSFCSRILMKKDFYVYHIKDSTSLSITITKKEENWHFHQLDCSINESYSLTTIDAIIQWLLKNEIKISENEKEFLSALQIIAYANENGIEAVNGSDYPF